MVSDRKDRILINSAPGWGCDTNPPEGGDLSGRLQRRLQYKLNQSCHRPLKNGMAFSRSFFPPGVQQVQCGKKNVPSSLPFWQYLRFPRSGEHYPLTHCLTPCWSHRFFVGTTLPKAQQGPCASPNVLQLAGSPWAAPSPFLPISLGRA